MNRSSARARYLSKSFARGFGLAIWALVLVSSSVIVAPQLSGRERDAIQYGAGLIVNVPLPESEVVQAVQDVVQNGIIRGTKEYNKDEYITGAITPTSSRSFPPWTEGGKVFYKQRLHALDPRNFKDSGDVGTLTVRYVIQGLDEKSTVLRIDAIFVEDFRRTSHLSNGSVESSEYKDIHDHLEATALMKEQAAEAEKEKQERRSPQSDSQAWSSSTSQARGSFEEVRPMPFPESRSPESKAPESATVRPSGTSSSSGMSLWGAQTSSAQNEPQSLEKRVQSLRQQVERLVKAPGAPLKSAPFHTASTLRSLSTGTEILIVISTSYWYGVETHDGQHGWISRDELEPLP